MYGIKPDISILCNHLGYNHIDKESTIITQENSALVKHNAYYIYPIL